MALPLPTGSELELLEAYTHQGELFAHLEVSSTTVEGARQFLHSGKTTSRDAESAAAIVAAANLGWSVRRIAREQHHSRNTVVAVLRLAERAGKVEPVKERVLSAAAEAVQADIELGNDLADRVRAGLANEKDLSALASLRRSTWVGAGIVADKELAAGAERRGSAVAVQVNVSLGSVVEEYATRLRRLGGDLTGDHGQEQAKSADIPGPASDLTSGAPAPAGANAPAAAPGGAGGGATPAPGGGGVG